MYLKPEMWDSLYAYLLYDKKFDDSKKNVQRRQSTFNLLCRYFDKKEFNRANFTEFIRYLIDKGYSKEYANTFIKLAKHIDKHFEVNQLADYTMFSKTPKYVDVLTYDQIKSMADVTMQYAYWNEERNAKYKALLYVMMLTGARIDEVLSLKWENLRDTPYCVIIEQNKTKDLRAAPLDRETYELVQKLPKYGTLVFCSKEGNKLDDTTVNLELKRRAEAVGIKKRVYNHLIRHSYANFMLRGGAPMHIVSRLMGHKDISTTNEYYTHVMIDELIDIMNTYHPHLKQNQTIDSIKKRVHTMLENFVNKEKFDVKLVDEKDKLSVTIEESK